MPRQQQVRRQQAARRAVQRGQRRTRQQGKKRLRKGIYLAISGIIAALVIVSLFLPSTLSNRASAPRGPGQVFDELPADHISEGTRYDKYNSVPPTSGPHWASVESWGIHTEPMPNELQVHNLEHGGVLIQYNTQDTGLITKLEEFARKQSGFPCYLVVAPYPDMSFPVALTAWGVRDVMDMYDEPRIQAFVDAYLNQGPEKVACVP